MTTTPLLSYVEDKGVKAADVADVLEAAAVRISGRRWRQHSIGAPVEANSKVCAMGGINAAVSVVLPDDVIRIAYGSFDLTGHGHRIEHAAQLVVDHTVRDIERRKFTGIVHYNDVPGRSAWQVKRKLLAAARRLRKEAGLA